MGVSKASAVRDEKITQALEGIRGGLDEILLDSVQLTGPDLVLLSESMLSRSLSDPRGGVKSFKIVNHPYNSLKVSWDLAVFGAFCRNVRACQGLRTIFLIECALEAAHAGIVAAEILAHNSSLIELDLTGNAIGPIGASSIADSLASNNTLRMLTLVRNSLGDAGAGALGKSLARNGALEILRISDNRLSDDGALALGDGLRSNNTLVELALDWNAIATKGAASLASALAPPGDTDTPSTCVLECLNLGHNTLEDDGVALLGKVLMRNTSLRALYLDWNQCGEVGAEAVACGLRENQTLTAIFLEYNLIRNQGAIAIANALSSTTPQGAAGLRILNVTNNDIDVEGGVALGNMILSNPSLTSLSMAENPFAKAEAASVKSFLARQSHQGGEQGGSSSLLPQLSSAHTPGFRDPEPRTSGPLLLASCIRENSVLLHIESEGFPPRAMAERTCVWREVSRQSLMFLSLSQRISGKIEDDLGPLARRFARAHFANREKKHAALFSAFGPKDENDE